MTDHPVLLVLVFVLGAAVGSWLNVVILRTHNQTPHWLGRSRCPHCHRTLEWWELIPVVSFIALGGRCRTCHRDLDPQYLIVELLTGVAFLIVWRAMGWTAVLLTAWLVAAAMISIAVYDARWSVIPDSFTLSLALAAILFVTLSRQPWLDSLLGGLVGATFFALQYFLSRRRWVGSGDILLGLALGLLLGWRMLGLALMGAYFLGALSASTLIILRRANHGSAMAFGPYLMLGGFLTWLWGPQVVEWYFRHAIFF
ncbi:MAG: prepilin peptidase [Candidatus Kerfeldbacteria bacterium]|nr:prepilin peptidase [Candidatus Kerfeldbacteria bacterium]